MIGAASCALVAGAGRRLMSPAAGLAAGLVLALYPPAIFHDLLLQKSVLDLFFMCAALAAFARERWLLLGLSIGCLTLTRENAIVLVAPILVWLLVGGSRARAVYERADATRLAEEATGRRLSAGEVSSYYVGRVGEYIRDHPSEWLRLEWRKFLFALNATEVADTEDQYAHADHSPVLRWLGVPLNMGVLVPLAVAGVWVLGLCGIGFGPFTR